MTIFSTKKLRVDFNDSLIYAIKDLITQRGTEPFSIDFASLRLEFSRGYLYFSGSLMGLGITVSYLDLDPISGDDATGFEVKEIDSDLYNSLLELTQNASL